MADKVFKLVGLIILAILISYVILSLLSLFPSTYYLVLEIILNMYYFDPVPSDVLGCFHRCNLGLFAITR